MKTLLAAACAAMSVLSVGGTLAPPAPTTSGPAIPSVRPDSGTVIATLTDSPPTGPTESVVPVAAMTTEAYVQEMIVASFLDTLNFGGRFVVNDQMVPRTDAAWRTRDSLVRRRVADLQGRPLEPRYYMGLAHLEIQLGQDVAAQQHVRAWLTSPGVTTQDSITALSMAIGFFLEREVTTARLAIARGYLAQLATFRTPAARGVLYDRRLMMMGAFDRRGQSDSAAAWGLKAYAVLKEMPYLQRAMLVINADPLETLLRLLAGQPGGAARSDSLLAVLKGYVTVPPSAAELAADTALQEMRPRLAPMAQAAFDRVAQIGKPMPPLVATHWLNQAQPGTMSDATPGARVLPLDDGVIRILDFGWFSCPHCKDQLRWMQHALPRLPKGVQVLYYDVAEGNFGGDICTPEEEAENVRKWYLERMHLTFPIALWMPVKDTTPGGAVLPRKSPVWTALHISAGPTVYIVDGHGNVRYREVGATRYDDNTRQSPFRRALDAVVQERDAQMGARANNM